MPKVQAGVVWSYLTVGIAGQYMSYSKGLCKRTEYVFHILRQKKMNMCFVIKFNFGQV